jgi:hypothetical protein
MDAGRDKKKHPLERMSAALSGRSGPLTMMGNPSRKLSVTMKKNLRMNPHLCWNDKMLTKENLLRLIDRWSLVLDSCEKWLD